MQRLITSKTLANWLPTASRRLLASSSSTSTPSGAPSAAPSASTPLIVTERAFKRLQTITQPGEVLRIVVEGGGCSGFEYKLDLDNKVNDDDEVVENEGQKVVVDKMSLEFIRGSTIDYTQEMMRSAFRITDNPLADKGCSCGSSFSVKL